MQLHLEYAYPIDSRNISVTMQDRGMVITDHLQETAHCGSLGHVIDDVTWPQTVKVMTTNVWGLISRKPCEIQGWC